MTRYAIPFDHLRIGDVGELTGRGVRTAVITNPNYLEENATLLRSAGLDVALVDLMEQAEVNADPD